MGWVKLASQADLPPGGLIEVEHGEDYVALCNVGGEVRAMNGTCPHQGGPLGEGALHGEYVTCPWHMWDFHSVTGASTFNERVRVAVYPVREEAGQIFVDVPGA